MVGGHGWTSLLGSLTLWKTRLSQTGLSQTGLSLTGLSQTGLREALEENPHL